MKETLSQQNLFGQLISSQLITNKNIWFILKEDKIGLTLKIDKLNKLKKQMHMSNNKVLLLFFDIIIILWILSSIQGYKITRYIDNCAKVDQVMCEKQYMRY